MKKLASPSKITNEKEKQKKKVFCITCKHNKGKHFKIFKEGLVFIVQFNKNLELSPCDSHIKL